jgi:SpoIID/LytB domain protein
MRRYLGSDVLRSSDFSMTVDGDLVRISGHGAGDGVGVCLTGAQRMAERGADARRILQSYYPTAYLELVPPEGLQTQRALAEGAHEGYRRYAR